MYTHYVRRSRGRPRRLGLTLLNTTRVKWLRRRAAENVVSAGTWPRRTIGGSGQTRREGRFNSVSSFIYLMFVWSGRKTCELTLVVIHSRVMDRRFARNLARVNSPTKIIAENSVNNRRVFTTEL